MLDLPHDWAIEGPFDPAISPHQGSLPYFGVAWYRKRFEVPESARGRYYALEIDGAMSNATVFLNGRELGGRPYGYIGFAVDLTPHLRFGGENVVAVRLAPEPESSRWYPGAGLYRHVWIEATGPVHVERWGTYVTTPAVTEAGATVAVRTELRNREADPARVTLETVILDPEGREVARSHVEPDRARRHHRRRLSSGSRARAHALGRRPSAPLHGDQHREARRRRARPVRDALRHPDDRVGPGQGLPPERPPRAR